MPTVKCQQVIDGVMFDPLLPKNFFSTCNSQRPESHRKFFNVPIVLPEYGVGDSWLESWPEGIRYDVWCLDGGCWDRPTWKGSFNSLDDAVSFIKENYIISLVQNGWTYQRVSSLT